ncbi:MAG: hypothetical protein U1B80_05265, partial [Anaerolineaceae bacterium]|nr:hypothetical protein [Anaerolineaceae bacterium]
MGLDFLRNLPRPQGRTVNRERRWVIVFAVIVLLITALPYLIGFSRQGTDWSYTGFAFGVEDGNSYIAKMLSGATGAWLFRSPYSAYPQRGLLAFLPYILLGKLTAPPAQHEQLVALYHLYRCLAGFMMILASYDFASVFISSVAARRLATVAATLGGGFGWFYVLGFNGWWQGRLPLEFYSPETFGFLALFGLPHVAVARALLLWGLKEYLTSIETGFNPRAAARAGGLWLAMGLFAPQTVAVGWAVIAGHLLATIVYRVVCKREPIGSLPASIRVMFQSGGMIVALSSTIVIYTLISFQTDPYLSQWLGQNLILSPPPRDYLLAYAILLPFAVVGIFRLPGNGSQRELLLVGWVALLPLLAYIPHNLQRRLVEGGWAVLAVLAVLGFNCAHRSLRRVAIVVVAASMLSSLVLVLGGTQAVWNPARPLFRPAAEIEAMKSLAETGRKGAVVLASNETSNALPAWVSVRTVVGHGPESARFAELLPRVEMFFQSQTSDDERKALLSDFGVGYI